MADLARRLGFVEYFILCELDELDVLAGLLLERGDDLRDRRVPLGVEALLPPDDEVGAAGAERRQNEHGGEDDGANSEHGRPIALLASMLPRAGRGNGR